MITEAIRRFKGYDHNAYTYYPVIIIGAGASGIAMGCQLKQQLGFDQFRIFDRQAGIGGTWWINRYPGVACDIPATFYSFSFAQNPNWTSFHPPGSEIVQYYHEVCEKYKITDKFELNTDIVQCTWLEDEQLWEVKTRRMVAGMGDLSEKDRMKLVKEKGEDVVYSEVEIVKSKVLVSCVGGLVEPRGWPDDITGLDDFKGPVFHSARWDQTVDFNDKNVVVVGTGCSSAQIVPTLPNAPYNAKSVTQLMRSPPWVVKALDAPGGDEWWEKNGPKLLKAVPPLMNLFRFLVFCNSESEYFKLFPTTPYAEKGRKKYEEQCLEHLKKTVPEKYHEIMTPDYGVGCKRRIFDKRWLQSLNDPKIELTTQPLRRVKENSVIIGPGATYPANAKDEDFPEKEIPADIIVLANGFDTTRWLHPLRVAGKGGKDLVEVMVERGGAQAYQGTAMDGFPNFFMIFGPNTATGHSSVVMAVENIINFSLKFIKLVLNGEVKTVDVKHEAEVAYTADVQKTLKKMVWMTGGCSSWYYTKDGWNPVAYPYTQTDFWRRCTWPKWSDWNIAYTRKGAVKKLQTRAVRLMTVALVVVAAYRVRQSGLGVKDVGAVLQGVVVGAFMQLRQVLALLQSKILSLRA
ncbi:FAD/NAD(P)-binding domain-containing protein [Dothidotthia symphoricarpi CBS 119687]|uniref:FAD/NAD(P)-binding domain-containing protein n=1 Tax=Dothidotthia symphoricarpi CBS 119687 TaxID=1392245 RepID=A0A6A6AK21_9PLEO|nr:FAD/NAD(P)-binding domain-containing protein [Dothidotthia symphoricarpi CBS 119687]KAF2131583.1 FAD/NAD(P)-binding domain-containing protein [Dothidotthia symphoricarpi CBS 119687]